MILPDTNVLIRAFVTSAPGHAEALTWLEEILNSDETIALYAPIMVEFVRIVSNPKIWESTPSREDIWEFIDTLFMGRYVWLQITPDYWRTFRDIVQQTSAKGAWITDIGYAALAMDSGCRIATFDRDFARIPGLLWFTPGETERS